MNRKWMLAGLGLTAALPTARAQKAPAENGARNNVLFILCDDLRPELECYNHPVVKTPNINRLAESGVVFNRAFCNVPVSGASRASLLTGMRPTRNLFENWNVRVDRQVPEAVTLNQAFQEAGYTTVSNGKIFHHQDEASNRYWDDILPYRNPLDYHTEENLAFMRIQEETGIRKRGWFHEAAGLPEERYLDGRTLRKSVDDLRKLAGRSEPFFLAVGFVRPHLPFVAPKKYWELYPPEEIEIPDNYVLKTDHRIPARALTHWGELLAYRGIPDTGPLSRDAARTMIRGYYACVSFIDALIGQLLDELERLGLADNTTVVLTGDHGWNLGEHGMWCKHSVLETSLRVPLIIRTPGGLQGYRSNEIVELLDLYPTLCDVARLSEPAQLEGESLLPLLRDKQARSKGYAVARWENGFAYVEDRYSYTEWWDKDDRTVDRMLFDHTFDPEENYNVAGKPWYRHVVEELGGRLREARGRRLSE